MQRFQIDWRTVAAETLAKVTHPLVILVELLATGQGAPWDQFMHVGIAGVVADFFTLQSTPSGRADDLARLRLDVAETNFFVFAVQCQMHVVAPGLLAQRFPSLARHMAIGLWCQHHDDFGRINIGHDARHTLRDAFFAHAAIEVAQLADFGLGVPRNALAAIAHFVHQRAQGREALKQVRIIALDHRDLRCRLARNEGHFAFFPVAHVVGLGHFAGGVVHDGREYHILLYTQMANADLAHCFGKTLIDFPVAARLPGRLHRSR